MSEEATPNPDEPTSKPKRRKSTKKAAKSSKVKDAPVATIAPAIEDLHLPVESKHDSLEPDWPEAEISLPDHAPQRPKKKRRRKKGKASQPQHTPPDSERNTAEEGIHSEPASEVAPSRPQQQSAQPRFSADPQLLAKRAWKIYLAEVSEEGVALIGDNDAKDLARRCFRLAEIFIEEQSRRR